MTRVHTVFDLLFPLGDIGISPLPHSRLHFTLTSVLPLSAP
uniref:Uncharacterized protein n=1 Tax=Anguilla anguilla TaxID=7936 RepID=A0A0E9VWJ8_ANGAN